MITRYSPAATASKESDSRVPIVLEKFASQISLLSASTIAIEMLIPVCVPITRMNSPGDNFSGYECDSPGASSRSNCLPTSSVGPACGVCAVTRTRWQQRISDKATTYLINITVVLNRFHRNSQSQVVAVLHRRAESTHSAQPGRNSSPTSQLSRGKNRTHEV